MFGSFGVPEMLVILMVVLLLFGAKKIPELARGLGQGIQEFKNASTQIKKEIEEGGKETVNKDSNEKTKEKQQ
jgi:sec-independent protein translocase protein TatA